MHYNLIDKQTQPEFSYVVLTGSTYVDYYLFKEDELEDAMIQLKKEANAGFNTARIVVPHFSTGDRTWRFRTFMETNIYHKVMFDDVPHTLLHIKHYMDAGQWLNKRDEWKEFVKE